MEKMSNKREYEIPAGYEARIDGNKVIIEKKESEDERIRREIRQFICSRGMSLAQSKVDSWLSWLEKQGEQNLAWSEEEEEMVQVAINACNSYQDSLVRNDSRFDKAVKAEDWLKSLKDRVQPQPKQEWSEEEIEICAREAEDNNCIILAKHIRQLKSRRPQNTWKPTHKQINALYDLVFVRGCYNDELLSLYNDLLKLKE